MDDTLDLLLLLNGRGIRLYLQDGELRYRARKGTLTPELHETLRSRRSSLQSLLQSASHDPNCLVTIRSGSADRIPLFCPHTVHGGVFDYRNLAQGLAPDQPVYGFQALSFFCGEPLRTSVEEMAEYYAGQLSHVWPAGPVVLYGASAGGLIALEMARILGARGRQIGFVGLGDTIHPQYYETIRPEYIDRLHWVNFVEAYLPNESLDILPLDHPFWQQDEPTRIEHLVRTATTTTQPGRLGVVDYASVEMHHRAFEAYTNAFYSYRIRPFSHRLVFCRAHPPKPERYEPVLRLCSGETTLISMPFNHLAMIQPPGSYQVAAHLQKFINEVANQTGNGTRT
jgi:thioesterase domain-containing protein